MLSSRLASLVELEASLGVGDLYMLLDLIVVEAHNRRVVTQPRRR